jgi:hypothetical protein
MNKMPIKNENYQIDMGYLNEWMSQNNHRKSLYNLAKNGGLTRFEIYCNIKQIRLNKQFTTEDEKNKAINKEIAHLLEPLT